MLVSWYGKYDPKVEMTSFHYTQAVGLSQYCNMAIYYPYDQNIENWMEEQKEEKIYVYRSKYELKKKIRNRLYMYRTMRKIVKEFKPDIIHGQVATEAGRFAIILGKRFGIPVMITEHSSPDYSGVTSFPHHMYANFVYRYSRYNACVSDYVTERLQAIFPKYVFHTVYNGISTDELQDTGKKYRRADSANICIVAGHYDKYIKGIPMLLEVISKLKKEKIGITLHLVGGGTYTDYFIDLSKKYDIENECIFYGSVSKEEVYSIIRQMDFLVSTSTVESFGCNIAEALILGKPVLGTKCGGPESIINKSNGILIEKENPEELKAAIIEMINNYDTYDSKQISKNAIEKYSVDKISEIYYNIYCSLLQ